MLAANLRKNIMFLRCIALTCFAGVSLLLPLPVQGAEQVVQILGSKFVPETVTINPGDTVTWINQDTTFHTTTSTADPPVWDSDILFGGESFSMTFDTSGSYPYQCDFHAEKGTINVGAGTNELRLLSPLRLADGRFKVTLTTAPGVTYVLQGSTNLSTTNWSNLSTNLAATNRLDVLDNSATNFAYRFYRARVQ
jgi:plastocyanin